MAMDMGALVSGFEKNMGMKLPDEFKKVLDAIVNHDYAGYFEDAAKQWKSTGTTAGNTIADHKAFTGTLTAYTAQLKQALPDKNNSVDTSQGRIGQA